MFEISPFLFFIVLGTLLISAELLIFNLSIFWLLLIGIGAITTAIVAWLLPDLHWLSATVTFVIASTIVSILLYTPLRRWQKKPGAMSGSDAIGQTVDVLTTITANQPGKVRWSGTHWDAKLADNSEELSKGHYAEIVGISGIVLLIKKP